MKNILKYIVVFSLFFQGLFAQGVNLTAQEELDARYSGLAGVHLGFSGRETALSSHPAAIQDIEQLWFSAQYINRFSSLVQQHNFVLGLPLDTASTLALGLVYFGGDFIARESFFDTPRKERFYDLLFVMAYSSRFKNLDIGANAKIIYRQLDQIGLGIQADVSARYFLKRFQFDTYLRGLVPSSVGWSQTRLLEADVPELFISVSFHERINAVYGGFSVSLQTQGFVQNAPKSIESEQGGNIGDVESLLKTLKWATELKLDGGLSLRLSFGEIFKLIQFKKLYPNYGIGYKYKDIARVDYSFYLHPELEFTHAISLSLSPWWSRAKIERNITRKKYLKPLTSVSTETKIEDKFEEINQEPSEDEEEVLE